MNGADFVMLRAARLGMSKERIAKMMRDAQEDARVLLARSPKELKTLTADLEAKGILQFNQKGLELTYQLVYSATLRRIRPQWYER